MIFSVPCASCGRRTLNLTHIPRYGKVACFFCKTEIVQLPNRQERSVASPQPRAVAPTPARVATPPAAVLTASRAPKSPTMPTAAETRKVVEECLLGLERAAQDREMLHAPDLRAIISTFLDNLQSLFMLDERINAGEVTEEWLRIHDNLSLVARVCFSPLWPTEGMLLPSSVQVWVLAVDDAARRWQYTHRRWFAETLKLRMIPIVPTVTTTNPAWHVIDGHGQVVNALIAPGFLLGDEVLRKARVRA